MRIEAHRPAAVHSRDVDPKLTAVSRDQLREAIARAHTKVTGHPASAATLDVLTAHASLETSSGSRMYNFNFGGIKGRSPAGDSATCKTHEVIDGKDVTIKDGFRAYRTLDEGAVDYLKVMRDRFPRAMQEAARGDVDGFAKALKQSHYYTADESAYAAGLRGLVGGPGTHSVGARVRHAIDSGDSAVLSGVVEGRSPAEAFVGDSQLSKMLDSIGHHRAPEAEGEDEDE